MANRTYPAQIEQQFGHMPITCLGLKPEEVDQTDYCFYLHEGALYCESHDERLAFKWVNTLWVDVDFPLEFK